MLIKYYILHYAEIRVLMSVCLNVCMHACMRTKKCAYLSLLVLLETELKDLDIKSQAHGQTDTKHFRDFHMLAVVWQLWLPTFMSEFRPMTQVGVKAKDMKCESGNQNQWCVNTSKPTTVDMWVWPARDCRDTVTLRPPKQTGRTWTKNQTKLTKH